MNITDKLLDKYFKGQCTQDEQDAVFIYLNQTDDLPDHLLPKNEWDNLVDADLSREKTDQLFKVIRSKTFARFQFKLWFRNIAAAAVIFMAIGLGYYTFTTHSQKPKLALNEKKQDKDKKVIDWKSTVNYAKNSEMVVLPDGSEVKVYPGAEIRYEHPFVKTKREIYLSGKAYFQVAKDKKHPFVVYAGGVSTTALGTSFTITAMKTSHFVKVELHTGKVWVTNVESELQIPVFSNILKPGDVLKIEKLNPALDNSNKGIKIKSMTFAQNSLKEVFGKLGAHYHLSISFKDEDVKNKFFTGTLSLQKPLDTILAEITGLHKLKTTRSHNGYLIKK
ncbi:FecR family protein [Pedobacter frigoris]|uniref:FecR family protein n=1 Tax=Pedobacter frigoris TaxID=2571272 RepID=UPI00292E61C2|nr:FecR family protein [Pedobacter frigoris]